MGDDEAVLRKIRLGQLQGGALVSGSLAAIYPDNQVYSLPLIFRNFDEADYVRRQMDPTITRGLAEKGFVTLGMAGGGFAYLMGRSPVTTLEDLRLRKMWAPDNDSTAQEILQALGVSPIPLSLADVRAGLQTGLIDTVATSPVAAIALQWHTQIAYLTDTPLLYVYGVLAVSSAAFDKLSPAHQDILQDVMGRVFREIERQNIADNDAALQAMQQQGTTFVTTPPAVKAQWRSAASGVAEYLIKKNRLSRAILETLEKHLADHRSATTANAP